MAKFMSSQISLINLTLPPGHRFDILNINTAQAEMRQELFLPIIIQISFASLEALLAR